MYNYIKRSLKQASNKKVRPHEIQEGDFVPKRVLSVQPDSKGKWTPDYEGLCAMSFTTMNGGKLARRMKANAVKKYFVKKNKKNLAKLKTRKGGLGKNERLVGLKTRPGKKLETKKYNYPNRLKPEKGDLCKS